MKKKIIIITIFFIAIIIGYLIFNSLTNNSIIVDKNEDIYNKKEIMKIDVYEVNKNISFQQYVKTSGKITSFNIENINIGIGEKIKKIYVSDGEVVKPKQKIMIIDDGYSNRIIRASIKGVLFIIYNEDTLSEYKIYDTDQTGLNVPIADKDIPYIKNGQRAIVNVNAINKEIEGEVIHVSKLPSNNGKFNVKIKIPYEEKFNFGYNASVKIEIANNKEALIIPYECLNIDDDGRYYVVEEKYIEEYRNNNVLEEHRVYIETGNFDINGVEVIDGISEGMRILLWS